MDPGYTNRPSNGHGCLFERENKIDTHILRLVEDFLSPHVCVGRRLIDVDIDRIPIQVTAEGCPTDIPIVFG
jgi:hypothetical protein